MLFSKSKWSEHTAFFAILNLDFAILPSAPEIAAFRQSKVGNVTFDLACEKKQAVYAYYDTTPGGKLTQKLWNEIENSTTKKRPFYENEYIICTVNRVPDSFWTLSKRYDNVHIVSQKMLFATYRKEYNKVAHPRFVPSFVK